jgi:hypothetical protein
MTRAADDRGLARRELLQSGLGLFAALVAHSIPGCGDDTAPLGDAGQPGSDAAPDAAPDASPDAASDAAPDVAPDAALDATPDAAPDGTPDAAPDAALDAVVDADRDATGDTGMVDPTDPYLVPRDAPALPRLRSRIAAIGPLRAPDRNGLRLPDGFTSRVIARTGEPVGGTSFRWHALPDGGATYATADGGWIYVSNAEVPLLPPSLSGSASAVRFDRDGRITAASRILNGTSINCAGGKTPWHSWLSCEEITRGRVFECDPWGEHPAIARPALGVFKHEAAAVDPRNGHVYLTEDETDGRLYRFVPTRRTPLGHPDLREGALEVAEVRGDMVAWFPVPDPRFTRGVATRYQVTRSTAFAGGEGVWWHEGTVYFTTKGDDKVWAYNTESRRLRVIYDRAMQMGTAPLRGVDNLTVSCCGDVLVAEDGGTMQIVAILPDGMVKPLVQVVGHTGSEVCGPAFDPSGTRLYFSSQRGPDGGWTFEVSGPFHAPMP